MIDSRKNTITAKVSAQVVEFYRNVIRSLQTENMDAILGSRKYHKAGLTVIKPVVGHYLVLCDRISMCPLEVT
jgi:hypothetical protein